MYFFLIFEHRRARNRACISSCHEFHCRNAANREQVPRPCLHRIGVEAAPRVDETCANSTTQFAQWTTLFLRRPSFAEI